MALVFGLPVAAPASAEGGSVLTVGGARPATVVLPSAVTPAKPRAMVLLLHGYTGSGAQMRAYLGWESLAAARDVVLVFADGTLQGGDGPRFWNATDACCNFAGSAVDDAQYLADLVDSVTAVTPIDRTRVYLAGHSNGAFMSFAAACTHADVFAAVVAVAGATFAKAAECKPSKPVSVLAVHGTADGTVSPAGGTIAAAYPSAAKTLQLWAKYDGCKTSAGKRRVRTLNLDRARAGNETVESKYTCPKGIDVMYWRMQGVGHTPAFNASFGKAALDWMLRHRR